LRFIVNLVVLLDGNNVHLTSILNRWQFA